MPHAHSPIPTSAAPAASAPSPVATASDAAGFRPFAFGITQGQLRHSDTQPGVQYLSSAPLEPCAQRMSDRLLHWAALHPERSFMAQRAADPSAPDGSQRGDWQHLSWGQALARACRIGHSLLARGLSPERPVVILSENSLDHAQLMLGCLMVGVPYCSVSTAYATVSQDFEKLRHVLRTLTPGLVFAADGARYGRAIASTVAADVEVVLGQGDLAAHGARAFTAFDALHAQPLCEAQMQAVQAARLATDGDTIAKFLFTSGSTKLPKAVINTHRMWCANQQQMRQSMPALTEGWHVLVDWLPWSHTFAGNHNLGLVIYNGGTLYIDEGKPTPALMGQTLRNLREVSPTLYFNVPTGFEAIAQAMQTDALLRRNLLARVQMFFYAGAALAQPVWDSLYASEMAELGQRVAMTTGLGMTESAPFALFVTRLQVKAGDLGLPAAGLTLKLVPTQGKVEVRYRGDNITPGYWRNPQATQEAFDDEGYFCSGDAVAWIDPADPHQGLQFDGRIAEDFKLATGTFVSVGPLRSKLIALGAPYVQDAVITGLNQREVGAMLFPTAAVRQLAAASPHAPMSDVLAHPAVQARLAQLARDAAAQATGSASRVARLCMLAEPPSLDAGEITDKGSINQRAVLARRSSVVQALHAGTWPGTVLPEAASAAAHTHTPLKPHTPPESTT